MRETRKDQFWNFQANISQKDEIYVDLAIVDVNICKSGTAMHAKLKFWSFKPKGSINNLGKFQ